MAEVVERYATRRRWVLAIDLTALGLVAITFALHEAGALGIRPLQISTVLAVVAVAAHGVLWRCPACKGYLQAAFTNRFCPKCGAAFEADASTRARAPDLDGPESSRPPK